MPDEKPLNNFNSAMARARTQAQLRRGMFLLHRCLQHDIAAGYFSITETIKATSGTGMRCLHLDWAAIAIILPFPSTRWTGASPA